MSLGFVTEKKIESAVMVDRKQDAFIFLGFSKCANMAFMKDCKKRV